MLITYAGHMALLRRVAGHEPDLSMLNDRGQALIAGAVFKREDKFHVLIEAGADPKVAEANAIASAWMFSRADPFEVLGVLDRDGTDAVAFPPTHPRSDKSYLLQHAGFGGYNVNTHAMCYPETKRDIVVKH